MTEQAITEQALQQDVVLFEEIACAGGKIIGIAGALQHNQGYIVIVFPLLHLR